MANFTQTAIADAIAHTESTHPWSSLGSSLTPTAGALWTTITMHHAYVEAATPTNPPSFYVQINLGTTDESWTTVAQFTCSNAAVVVENLTATEPVGETAMTVAATAGFVAGDYIYIDDVGTAANSEWHQVQQIVTDTTIDLTAGLVTEKDTSDNIYSEAETFTMRLDLSGVARWRVIYLNEGGTSVDSAIWVRHIETSDIE